MQTVEEIKTAIESLQDKEYAQLRTWFSEKDWANWDKRIEIDSKTGKLDFLIKEAVNEKKDQ